MTEGDAKTAKPTVTGAGTAGGAAWQDTAPGDDLRDDGDLARGFRGLLAGLGLAALLTAASFLLPASGLVWGPAVPIALITFAIAQMGVHLVFFLHLTTAPDNTNNALALAFGVLIVILVIGGSIWIMTSMNQTMMPMAPAAPMVPMGEGASMPGMGH